MVEALVALMKTAQKLQEAALSFVQHTVVGEDVHSKVAPKLLLVNIFAENMVGDDNVLTRVVQLLQGVKPSIVFPTVVELAAVFQIVAKVREQISKGKHFAVDMQRANSQLLIQVLRLCQVCRIIALPQARTIGTL
mmetsp:Transcript_18988/g.31040  ORF Transcript_18988/g.31040 Transcript_18988/m.31040 type:complete len:136 (+) Transcript_18988:2633-3040(+)